MDQQIFKRWNTTVHWFIQEATLCNITTINPVGNSDGDLDLIKCRKSGTVSLFSCSPILWQTNHVFCWCEWKSSFSEAVSWARVPYLLVISPLLSLWAQTVNCVSDLCCFPAGISNSHTTKYYCAIDLGLAFRLHLISILGKCML